MPRFSTNLLLSTCAFAALAQAHEGPAIRYTDTRARLNGPSSLGLQAHALKDGPAVGANLVATLLRGKSGVMLAEAYAFKGDAELAGIGAGVVARHRISANRLLEVNAFMEGLRDRDGFSYPQIGLGLAYSEPWFTIRVNGYLPLRDGDDHRAGTREWTRQTRSLDGSATVVDWSQDRIAHHSPGMGFDAEVELRLPEPPRWLDPHLAIGYFYRAADDRSEVHAGMVARAELHFSKEWSLEAEWRDDAAEIGQEFRVVARFQKWFGTEDAPSRGTFASSAWADRAMFAPAERQPWPAVTRPERLSRPNRDRSVFIAAPEAALPDSAPDDCCPSSDSPLIFD